MHHVELYEFSISSDTVRYHYFSQSNRKECTMSRHFKRFHQISLSQSNRNKKSNMLSFSTERPVTIYRIEIICRRYNSTLKCFQSPNRQKQPSFRALAALLQFQDGQRADEHMGRSDLVPFVCAKKQTSLPWDPDSKSNSQGWGWQ